MSSLHLAQAGVSSQTKAAGPIVNGLSSSDESGFRDGSPVLGGGEQWDLVPEVQRSVRENVGVNGMVLRSGSSKVQDIDNEIPGSGRNNPKKQASHAIPPVGHKEAGGSSGPSGGGQGGSGGNGSGKKGEHPTSDGAGGSGGNGGDPHPGRSAGTVGGSNPPVYAGEGAAALLAKMFMEPLIDPVPVASSMLPCDTEELDTEREGKGNEYSPVMWADSLIPVNITVGSVSSAIDRLPAIGVSVSNIIRGNSALLSDLGASAKMTIETEATPTLLRSLLPVKGYKDIGAIISLMETSRKSGYQCLEDEAPLVRLGLLMHCIAPSSWYGYTTSCVHNLVANGYPDMDNITVSWTKAPATSTV